MHRRVLTLLFLACCLIWIAACDPLALPTPTPTAALPTATAQPTSTPESTPTTPAQLPTEEVGGPAPAGSPSEAAGDAQAELMQIESDTAKTRGLQPKEDVPEAFLPQDKIRANLTDEVNKDYPIEEARQDAIELWLLRLMDDPSTDLRKLQIDLLGEQVLGYYDHKKNELFVRSDQPTLSPLARETLAHEFTHSLQDQYFDLEKLRPDKVENDRGGAVLALIEGDATVSGLLYAQQYMSTSDFQALLDESKNASSKVLDSAPPYIRDSLVFPYDQGPRFVLALVSGDVDPALGNVNFKNVDAALADPPKSTEQILHPEKYIDKPRDEPVAVALPPLTDTLGAGWTQTDSDTIGEFDLMEMLKVNGLEESAASDGAAGWDGGHYALYQKGDSALLIMSTAWDTASDAAEFESAMRQSLATLKKDGALWSDGKRFFGLERSGEKITFVGGTDHTAVENALGAK